MCYHCCHPPFSAPTPSATGQGGDNSEEDIHTVLEPVVDDVCTPRNYLELLCALTQAQKHKSMTSQQAVLVLLLKRALIETMLLIVLLRNVRVVLLSLFVMNLKPLRQKKQFGIELQVCIDETTGIKVCEIC